LQLGTARATLTGSESEVSVSATAYEHIAIVNGLGAVYLRINRKARRIILRLTDEGEIAVTVPRGVPYGEALDFVLSRRDWIAEQQARRDRGENGLPPLPYEPPPLDRAAAAAILEPRIRELAALHGLTIGRIQVKAQRTLWGSCATGGRISINWKAARLPDHLRDYVILHELAHLRHRNHGPHYWHALDKLLGRDAKTLDRELRRWPLKLL